MHLMQDNDLNRLVNALDRVVEWAGQSGEPEQQLHDHLGVAALRLRCLSQRLGRAVDESPYLNFVRRICATEEAAAPLAAGA
jgi:hypothetical protein